VGTTKGIRVSVETKEGRLSVRTKGFHTRDGVHPVRVVQAILQAIAMNVHGASCSRWENQKEKMTGQRHRFLLSGGVRRARLARRSSPYLHFILSLELFCWMFHSNL